MGRNVSSITNIRPDQTLAELLVDEIDPWQHKPDSRICLPLGHAETIPMSEELPDTPGLGITGAYLKRYPGPDADPDTITDLRPGWVYVYLNGFLWREVKVTPNATFKDVDLRTYQGLDTRPASGLDEYTLLFPHRLRGEESTVQLAYSEVQWSWHRIVSLGGMDPEDPRRRHRVAAEETLSHLAQRYPGVANWQALADLNDLDDPDSLQEGDWLIVRPEDQPPADADDRRQTRMGTPVNERDEFHNDDGTLVLEDPLGVAATCNDLMSSLLMTQQTIIGALHGEHLFDTDEDIGNPVNMRYGWKSVLPGKEGEWTLPGTPPHRKPGEHWRDHCNHMTSMAQIAYSLMFDEASLEDMEPDMREEVEKARDETSQEDIEAWLHVEERRIIREHVRALRNALVDLLAQPSSPDQLALIDALADYAALPDDTYAELWHRYTELTALLLTDPASMDQNFDLPSTVENEAANDPKPGMDFLTGLYQPSGDPHLTRWHQMLFPHPDQIDAYDENAPDLSDITDPDPVTDTAFRPNAFASSLSVTDHMPANGAFTRHLLQRSHQVFDAMLKQFADWSNQIASRDSVMLQAEAIVRFCKATGAAIVEDIHLIENGQTMDGKRALGTYRVEELIETHVSEPMNRDQRQAASQHTENMRANGAPASTIMNAHGTVIGSDDLTRLRPYGGADGDVGWRNGDDVFKTYGKTGNGESLHVARSTFLATRQESYDQLVTSLGRSADSVSNSMPFRALPIGLLYLEGLNFREAKRSWEGEEDLAVERIDFFSRTVILTSASIAVVEAIFDKKQIGIALRESRHTALQTAGRVISFRISGRLIEHALYRWIHPIAIVIGAAYSAIDAIRALQRGEYGYAAAAGALTVTTLLGGLALSAGFFLVGGLLIVASIVALVIMMRLTPGPLEHWGRYGPFPRSASHRLSEDDLHTATEARAYLYNLLLMPRTELSVTTSPFMEPDDYTWMKMTVVVPGHTDSSQVVIKMDVEQAVIDEPGRISDYPETDLETLHLVEHTPHHNLPAERKEVTPGNAGGPLTLTAYFKMPKLTRLDRQDVRGTIFPQAFYQWQGSVYHQLDDDLTLPLGGTPDDPAWSTTKVITQP